MTFCLSHANRNRFISPLFASSPPHQALHEDLNRYDLEKERKEEIEQGREGGREGRIKPTDHFFARLCLFFLFFYFERSPNTGTEVGRNWERMVREKK